jgi:alpha-ketoglutarate-dependent taurine dioxygenase
MQEAQLDEVMPGGFGRVLHGDHPAWESADWAALQELVRDTGFVVIKGVSLDEDECEAVCYGLGDPVTYTDEKFGYGYKVLVHLGRDGDEQKVIQGRGSMPLHSDGLLANRRVDIVLLYCVDCRDAGGFDGATTVANQERGLSYLDDGILDKLEADGLEYSVRDRDYFTGMPESWYRIPAVGRHWDRPYLHVGLRYEEEVEPAWRVRVPGVSEAESDAILEQITDAMTRDDVLYQHQWESGDLLLVNNYSTLHGRNGFTAQRWLMNGQTKVPAWESHVPRWDS